MNRALDRAVLDLELAAAHALPSIHDTRKRAALRRALRRLGQARRLEAAGRETSDAEPAAEPPPPPPGHPAAMDDLAAERRWHLRKPYKDDDE